VICKISDRRKPRHLVWDFVATTSVIFLMLGLFLLPACGGLSWGPRYLSALFLLLAVLAWDVVGRSLALYRKRVSRQVVGVALVLLFVSSFIVQCVGIGLL
jgi:hypothetical protein